MLESRAAYGWFGVGYGCTGEQEPEPADETAVRIPYRVYKTKFPQNKTVAGSYDKSDKTIEVLFTSEQMNKKTNLGNRYRLNSYYFLFSGVRRDIQPVFEFVAKNPGNAMKNAKKWAKDNNCCVIQQITRDQEKMICKEFYEKYKKYIENRKSSNELFCYENKMFIYCNGKIETKEAGT